jgi:Entner-Doudoroff aldolase
MSAQSVLARLIRELDAMPIIAILRGLRSEEAIAVVEALYDAGIRVAEVPLNSPDPFETIALLVRHMGTRMLIGAGTVLEVGDVERLASIGCALCVAPNTNAQIIEASIAHGMVPLPGIATATEAFDAVAAGAQLLKVFPATNSASTLSALRTVLPKHVRLLAVGGVQAELASALRSAGAYGFGLGADIYRPGWTAAQVGDKAREWTAHIARLSQPSVQLLTQAQAVVGESARMDGDDVVWVDPPQTRLLRWCADSGELRAAALAQSVWSLGRTPDDHWIGASDTGFCRVDLCSGALSLGPLAPLESGCRFNDMTIDDEGGLWVGSMHHGLLAGKGGLFYASNVDAPVEHVATGLGVANGMAFSEDGDTLYIVDTLARTLLAYPRRKRQARLAEPVIVSDFMGLPGKPDGLAIAADGTLWIAMWGGGCIVQLARDGAFLQAVPIPAPHVSSLCFDAHGHAYVSTSRARLSAKALHAHPQSGSLFRVDRAAIEH